MNQRYFPTAIVLLALASGTGIAAAGQTGGGSGIEKAVKPFFAEHCTSCHGEKKPKGDLRLDNLTMNFDSPKVMAQWTALKGAELAALNAKLKAAGLPLITVDNGRPATNQP